MVINRSEIELILARKQMTATRICERAGFSRNRFYEIMRSKSVTPKTAGKMAAALEVDVTEIIKQ